MLVFLNTCFSILELISEKYSAKLLQLPSSAMSNSILLRHFENTFGLKYEVVSVAPNGRLSFCVPKSRLMVSTTVPIARGVT